MSDHNWNFNSGCICYYISYNGQITEVALLKPAVSVAQSNEKILWEACQQLGAIPVLSCSLSVFFSELFCFLWLKLNNMNRWVRSLQTSAACVRMVIFVCCYILTHEHQTREMQFHQA